MKQRLPPLVICITLFLLAGCHKEEIEPYVGTREARLAGVTYVAGNKIGPMPGVFSKVYFHPYFFQSEQDVLNDEMVRELRQGQFEYWPSWSGYRLLASTKFQVEPSYQSYWLIGSISTGTGVVRSMTLVLDIYDNPFIIAAYY